MCDELFAVAAAAAVGFVAHVLEQLPAVGFFPLSSVNVEADDGAVVSTSRKELMGDLAKVW